MNLTTHYLGFKLSSPLIPGASPLGTNLDMIRRLEDAGAPLIILPSLFEEQVLREELAINQYLDEPDEAYAEALSYLPDAAAFRLGPDEYLEHVRRVKAAVGVPVVGSLNGITPGGWLKYAALLEAAGADALELNLYQVADDLLLSGSDVEARALEVVRSVRGSVSIPIAVKLSPFFSSLPHFARQLDEQGADGLVLFNRFYEPEIDPERLEITGALHLSVSSELPLRLRWIGILYGNINASLAVTGGVHTTADVIRSIMAGASAVQTVAALLQHGPEYLAVLRSSVAHWLEEHEYDSLEQMLGSMSHARCPQPHAYERANYVKILQTWNQQI